MPLVVKRKERILKYWMKSISNKNTLLYRVYKLELEMLETDNNNTVNLGLNKLKISYVNLALHTYGILSV